MPGDSSETGWFGNIWQRACDVTYAVCDYKVGPVSINGVGRVAKNICTVTRDSLTAVPSYMRNFCAHPRTNRLGRKLGRVLYHDVAPVAMTYIAWSVAERQIYGTAEDPVEDVSTLARIGYWGLSTVCVVIINRTKLNMVTRNAVLVTNAPTSFNEASLHPPVGVQLKYPRKDINNAVCNSCTFKAQLKGDVLSGVTYFANILTAAGGELAASILYSYDLKLLSWTIWTLAQLNSIETNGEVLQEARLIHDGFCEKHRTQYSDNHAEERWVFGIMHELSARGALLGTTLTIRLLSGGRLNPDMSSLLSASRAMTYILNVGWVFHSPKKNAVPHKHRTTLSLIRPTRRVTSGLMEVLTPGVIKVIERRLKKEGEPLSIEEIATRFFALYQRNLMILRIFLPDILIMPDKLIRDPVVGDSMTTIRNALLEATDTIQPFVNPSLTNAVSRMFTDGQFKKGLVEGTLALASYQPEQVAKALKSQFGLPKLVPELVLKLLNDRWTVEQVFRLRSALQCLDTSGFDAHFTQVSRQINKYLGSKEVGGRTGQRRARFYNQLLIHSKTRLQKLIICFAIASNSNSSDFRDYVARAFGITVIYSSKKDKRIAAFLTEVQVQLREAIPKDKGATARQLLFEKISVLVEAINKKAEEIAPRDGSVDVIGEARTLMATLGTSSSEENLFSHQATERALEPLPAPATPRMRPTSRTEVQLSSHDALDLRTVMHQKIQRGLKFYARKVQPTEVGGALVTSLWGKPLTVDATGERKAMFYQQMFHKLESADDELLKSLVAYVVLSDPNGRTLKQKIVVQLGMSQSQANDPSNVGIFIAQQCSYLINAFKPLISETTKQIQFLDELRTLATEIHAEANASPHRAEIPEKAQAAIAKLRTLRTKYLDHTAVIPRPTAEHVPSLTVQSVADSIRRRAAAGRSGTSTHHAEDARVASSSLNLSGT